MTIDVFGTIKMMPQAERDRVAGMLAQSIGLPPSGPWSVALEWLEPDNLLREPGRGWRVDVAMQSPEAVILIDCGFTVAVHPDSSVRCAQTVEYPFGDCEGKPPRCNGNYEMQVNPVNGCEARCALTGAGYRYWDFIPTVFGLSADKDHSPCPFAGWGYLRMPSLVKALAYAQAHGLRGGFMVFCADVPGAPVAANSRRWLNFAQTVKTDQLGLGQMSYQALVDRCIANAQDDVVGRVWTDLRAWLDQKIIAAYADNDPGN